MESQIHGIAILAYVDELLDEMHEEFGDLPDRVKEKERKAAELKKVVQETEQILADIKKFVSTSKVTLVELKSKEEKLAKQQFKVRNNKEFDAITKEISHIRNEHGKLTEQMRTEGIKEENLMKLLKDQKSEFEEAHTSSTEMREELKRLASDQNEEVKELYEKRKVMIGKINEKYYIEYERIRKVHSDAAVQVNKNSCSGCFSAIPPQKIVELRNNLDDLFFCETCGRILYPEEVNIEDDILEKI